MCVKKKKEKRKKKKKKKKKKKMKKKWENSSISVLETGKCNFISLRMRSTYVPRIYVQKSEG